MLFTITGSGKMINGDQQMITTGSFGKGYKPRIQANELHNAAREVLEWKTDF